MAKSTPHSLIAMLMLSSALVSPSAYAQTTEETQDETGQTTGDDIAPEDQPAPEDQEVDISGPGSNDNVIVVRGTFIPNPIRRTPEVVSVLSEAEIARAGDGDIAGALQRVTGLSLVGGRFVFVRGLGDRYSAALLNGSPLPSPEPLRRTVPLDIFPTSVIASTVVQKSYSVAYPGEFGGGVINLTTKATPEEPFLTIGGDISGNTATTGELGYTYYGSDLDFLGFDDGTRDIPSALRPAFDNNLAVNVGDDFSLEDIQNITASLVNAPTTLVQRNDNIPVNFSVNITGGTTFQAGDVDIGVIATAGWKNNWRTRFGTQQPVTGVGDGGALFGLQNFDYVTTQNRVIVNGLLGITAEFGENVIRWTNIYIRDTAKEARLRTGNDLDFDADIPLFQQRTTWFERQLIDTQLVGEFDFGALDVDVRASYANAQRESPYERDFQYVFNDDIEGSGVGDFVNDLASSSNVANIAFSDLNDDTYGASIDFAYDLPTATSITLSAGYAYFLNERDSLRRDFQFTTADGGALPSAVAQERPDFLLSDFNVYNFGVILQEFFGVAGAQFYSAELEIHGLYAQIDAEIAEGLRFQGGVRYEDGSETVLPVDLFGLGSVPITPTNIDRDYFLPAGTLTWNFAPDMQLRLHGSKTVARPQFRELAQQFYIDFESDRNLFGNPLLVDTELTNFEARFEWYPGRGERITAAAFYKDLENPIEQIVFQQGSVQFQTFANAPSAELYGFEVEAVKYFDLYSLGGKFFGDRRLLLAANYTYTNSSLNVAEDDLVFSPTNPTQPVPATNLFVDGDPLVGQSDHLVNLQFGMEAQERLSQQTILLTYNSPRVTFRGAQGQPNFIEDTGVIIDFVWREGITVANKEVELQFEIRNILDDNYVEDQRQAGTRLIRNSYEYGTTFSLGAKVTF